MGQTGILWTDGSCHLIPAAQYPTGTCLTNPSGTPVNLANSVGVTLFFSPVSCPSITNAYGWTNVYIDSSGGSPIFNVSSMNIINPDTGVPIMLVPKLGGTASFVPLPDLKKTILFVLDLTKRLSAAYDNFVPQNPADFTAINALAAKYGKIKIAVTSALNIEIPVTPAAIAPTITSLAPNPAFLGNQITITGSGFSPTGNTIHFDNTANAQEVSISNVSSNGTTMAVTLAAPLVPASYLVKAKTGQLWSNEVGPLQISVQAPSSLTASIDILNARVNLSWTAVPSIYGYEIQRMTQYGTGWQSLGVVTAASTTFADSIRGTYFWEPQFSYRVRAYSAPDSTAVYSDYSNVATLSTCVKMAGTVGTNKVVFMRGKTMTYLTGDNSAYIDHINNFIINSFNVTEPFKSFKSNFQIYADLRQLDEVNFGHRSNGYYASSVDSLVQSTSSCGSDANTYAFLTNDSYLFPGGYTTSNFPAYVYVNIVGLVKLGEHFSTTTNSLYTNLSEAFTFSRNVILHELSHAIGLISDEYAENDTGFGSSVIDYIGNAVFGLVDYDIKDNCTFFPNRDYSYDNGLGVRMYGSVATTSTQGCRHYNKTIIAHTPIYRPNVTSIMREVLDLGVSQFNVIDCGYIIAGILKEYGGSATGIKAKAEKYWPLCLTMANHGTVLKDGIPDPVPKANVNSVSVVKKTASLSGTSFFARLFENMKYALLAQVGQSILPVTAGDGITISGSGFTHTDNWAKLTNTKNSNTYTIDGISSNGSTLSFDIPTTTPEGTYSLKVAAFNSDWVSTGATLSVVGYSGAINPTVNIVTRIAGRVLTSAEANGCVANRTSPNGTKSAGGCVYTLTNQPLGSYNVEWLSGYPIGADKTKRPTISPPYPQTLGVRPAGSNPLTYYIDFAAAPTSVVNVVARLDGTALLPTVNGTCSAIIKNPSGVTSAGTCTRTLTGQSLGTYSVTWSGGYPTGADTTKQPTIATPTLVLNATSTGNKINFYLDFVGQSKPALQNLTATVAGKSINLTWNNPNGLTGDMMPEQSQKNPTTGTWSSWTNANTDGCDKDSCTIYIGIAQGTIYKFRVRVYDPATSAYSGYSNETAEVSLSTPPPTASLTIQGLHNYVYAPSQGIRYKWSSTDADTFSVSYTSNSAPWCGNANSSSINSASGESTSFATGQIHLGCIWTVTYTAKDSKTGRTASDTVTVSVTQQGTSLMAEPASLEIPITSPATSLTASLTIEGQHSYTYKIGPLGQANHYAWSSTGAADTYSSTYSSTGPSQCGNGGPWVANTAHGESSSYMSSAYIGCTWTVTYTAKDSTTGQSASDTVVVSVVAQ